MVIPIARLASLFTVLLGNMVGIASGQDPADYQKQIKPLLKERCYACHGALKQEAGLRLDTGALIRQGGDSGGSVSAAEPESSLLLQRVSSVDASTRMPPEGEALTAAQIDLIRQWISQGANSPADEAPEADPREHWAFQPLRRPPLPRNEGVDSPEHPVDAFLNAELTRHGLTARPLAPKPVLLRRVTLDLIGLPPTEEELLAFLEDDKTDAYERVVDRLLNDVRYGERWGRHWMDVWRYSDWYGRRDVDDVRNSASQIYRWRDWIVQSLNADKGYDRMIQEMLAADEICPEDYDAGVATGYLIRNYYSLNPNDWMRNAVEHTGKAFLGLTFNCAHCHDHKYDPIAHDDYFRLRAFFEPIFIRQDRVPGEADPGIFQDYTYSGTRSVQRLGAVRVYDRSPEATTWFYTGGDERNRVTERGSIPPGVPVFLQSEPLKTEPVSLPALAWYPGLRPEIQETMRTDLRRAIAEAEQALAAVPVSDDLVFKELQDAEAAYALAVEQARQSGHPGALNGEQSLLLNGIAGRTNIQNGLDDLKSLDDGMAIEFQLLILQDDHVNFQLVKDSQKGLTADYVAWEKGRIMAYRTGTDSDVEVGRYDFSAGQSRFHVSIVLQPTTDEAFLTVRSVSDNVLLVDRVSTRLNGWTPVGNDIKTVSFDARPGSATVIDDVFVLAPATEDQSATKLISFDFEPPHYADGSTPVGTQGWAGSAWTDSGGITMVSRAAGNPELREVVNRLNAARQKACVPQLRRKAAETRLAAARSDLASLEGRISADQARYLETSSDVSADEARWRELARIASRLERESKLLQAESEVLSKEVALIDAEGKPSDDSNRGKEIETATAALASARTAVTTARAAMSNEELAETYSPLSIQYPKQSTGRRRALAEWITNPANPLTSRVAMNHLWTRHFHSPLVASTYDFGRNGAQPTHPELIDWLAAEFMDVGWKMKPMHRLIVTSEAYRRLSSVGDSAENVAADPENRFLWKMNTARMESEVVRDSLLFVSGQLDLTMGGVELENKDALTTHRRSLYYSIHPEAGGRSALGELFDAPDPLDCYRRVSSVVPQQALVMTNSDFVKQCATVLVDRWQQSAGAAAGDNSSSEDFIAAMFRRILTRSPSEKEFQICLEALRQQQLSADKPDSVEALTQARESLVRILLNHNDFLTVR